MFVIGALNPQVGNDRRNQLLKQLMQQYMGQSGGAGIPPTNLMRQTPTFGTAVRAAAANMAPGGRPEFTGQNFIPASVFSGLGPGGAGRAPANVTSPAAGVPIPGIGRGGGAPTAPAGPQVPFAPNAGGPVSAAPVFVPPTPTSAAPVYVPPGAPGAPSSVGGSPIPGNVGGGGVVPFNPLVTGGFGGAAGLTSPAPAPTTSNGLVPLGNGIYYQPGVGVVGSPMGGLGAGVQQLGMGGRMVAV